MPALSTASVQAAEPRSDKPLRVLLTRRTSRNRIVGIQNIFASLDYLPQQDFDGTLSKDHHHHHQGLPEDERSDRERRRQRRYDEEGV